MNRLVRELLEVADLVGDGQIGPMVAIRAKKAAETYRADGERRRKNRLDKSRGRRQAETAGDLAAAERTAKVRAAVWKRCGGLCELHLAMGGHAWRVPATELHHILNGADRGPQEAPETCLGLCQDHHDAMHAKGALAKLHLEVLEAAHELCTRLRFHVAAAALARRIEKVFEARRPVGRVEG